MNNIEKIEEIKLILDKWNNLAFMHKLTDREAINQIWEIIQND